MSTMNVSLPDELEAYVDEQVGDGVSGSASEYVRDLIRRDRRGGRGTPVTPSGYLGGPSRSSSRSIR
jgi:hypothetical protein